MEYILGAVVSLVAQLFKKWASTKDYGTLAIVLGLSLLGATIYWLFVQLGYLDLLIKVLTTAGAFYTFIIRRFEKPVE